MAAYLPTRDAWIELRQYATRQHLTIDTAYVPDAWADAVAQASQGSSRWERRPSRSRAPVIVPGSGTANRSPASIRSRSPCSSSAPRPIRPAICCGCRSSTTRCAEGVGVVFRKAAIAALALLFFAPPQHSSGSGC